jgi:tetratricopeptide (TPR) repeat protein
LVFLSMVLMGVLQAQPRVSLRRYGIGVNDTMRMAVLGRYGLEQKYGTYDTAIRSAQEYLSLAEELHYPPVELHARLVLANATLPNNEKAGMDMMYDLEHRLQQSGPSRIPPAKYIEMLSSGDAPVDEAGFFEWVKGLIYQSFSTVYWMNQSRRAEEFNDKAMAIFRKVNARKSLAVAYLNLGLRVINADSGLMAFDSAYYLARNKGNMEEIMADALSNKVNILKLKDRWEEYLKTVKELDSLGSKLATPEIMGWNQVKYGEYYRHRKMPDSAIIHFKKAMEVSRRMDFAPMAYWASRYLYETYRSIDVKDSALVYLEKMNQASIKAQSTDEFSKFWDLDFQKNVELKAELDEVKKSRSRLELGLAISGLLLIMVFIVARYQIGVYRRRAEAVFELGKNSSESTHGAILAEK